MLVSAAGWALTPVKCQDLPEAYVSPRLYGLAFAEPAVAVSTQSFCSCRDVTLLPLPQLVCFYFVLTTFTTVGYGQCRAGSAACAAPFAPSPRSDGRLAGDIAAESSGERVLSSALSLATIAAASLVFGACGGPSKLPFADDYGRAARPLTRSCGADLLRVPLLLCGVALRHPHLAGQ